MSFPVSFSGYTPAPRYDGVPWSSVQVEEAAESTGPFTVVAVQALSPLDADPAAPQPRSFTVLASSGSSWFRVTFLDTVGGEDVADPVRREALAADALVTLEEARDYLGEPGADGEVLQAIINGVSLRILAALDRRRVVAADATTYRFAYDGQGFLDLDPYELRGAPTSVTLQSAGAGTLAAAVPLTAGVDYDLRPPEGTRNGTYTWLTLYARQEARVLSPGYTVAITGDWGLESVPGDVKLAALIAVDSVYRNPEQFRTRRDGTLEASAPASGSVLPDASWDLMRPYLRNAA